MVITLLCTIAATTTIMPEGSISYLAVLKLLKAKQLDLNQAVHTGLNQNLNQRVNLGFNQAVHTGLNKILRGSDTVIKRSSYVLMPYTGL